MTASFPGTIVTLDDKRDNVNTVLAAHVNALQDEVTELEKVVGVQPHVSHVPQTGEVYATGATWPVLDNGTGGLGSRLKNIEIGIAGDTHTQYVKTTGGSAIQPDATTSALSLWAATGQTAPLMRVVAEGGVTFPMTLSGTGDLTVHNLTVTGNTTTLGTSSLALDLGATSSDATSASPGANFGDKIMMYGKTHGFGVNATPQLVAYVPSTSAFVIAPATATGKASSGTPAITLGGNGTGTFGDVVVSSKSLPRGYLGGGDSTSDVTFSTETNVPGLGSISAAVATGRRVRVLCDLSVYSTAAADEVIIRVYVDGSVPSGLARWTTVTGANRATACSMVKQLTGLSAGAHTFRVTATKNTVSSGVCHVQSGAGGLIVEDIGT